VKRGGPWRTLWQIAGMSMGTHLVVVGVGQAGHQPRLDSAAASDDQGSASGHGRQYARPMSRCLGHLVSSLSPPSNSAIGPALWARRGTIRPDPGSSWSPPQAASHPRAVPAGRRRRPRRNELDAGVCRAGWYSRQVRASAERGRVQGPGRAEADFGPPSAPLCPALPCRAGHLARRTRHHGRVPEVDDDQLAALRRLRAKHCSPGP
jgi:hypothetical protein